MSSIVEIAGLVKDYRGLRPLRVASLTVRRGERISIAGLDAQAAEIFINILNGAILPDAGDVRVFGRSTRDITTESEWLESLERFGIVSERAMLLDASTVMQNLALPFGLEIDPVPDDVAARVRALASRVGIADEWLERPAIGAPPEVRMRMHLAKALAPEPALLLLEHPTARLADERGGALARDIARAIGPTQEAVLAITEDERLFTALGGRALRLKPATGALTAATRWRSWFGW